MHEKAVVDETVTRCECGGETKEDIIDIAVWTEKGLVVIEKVAVRICSACSEQFYDEATVSAMVRLTTSGYPADRIVREIRVPVYSLTQSGDETTAASSADPQD